MSELRELRESQPQIRGQVQIDSADGNKGYGNNVGEVVCLMITVIGSHEVGVKYFARPFYADLRRPKDSFSGVVVGYSENTKQLLDFERHSAS